MAQLQALKEKQCVSIILCNVLKCYSALFFYAYYCFWVCLFFLSFPPSCAHPRPKWYFIVGCVYLFRFLNGFSSTSCPSLYTKRLRRPERLCIVYFDPPSALNKPTAPLQALLEHGHLMNQRLYVQRPSVLTPLLRFEHSSPHAEGGESHSRTSQPSHQKHHRSKTNADGMRDNFLRKWIFQIFYGFLLGEGGVSFARSVRRGQQLPPNCVQFKSIARFLRVEIYFWGSRHPQCSVKIPSCTFAFSTHVWFSTSFFPLVHKDQ